MELSKQVISLELAKRLNKLGVKQDSLWSYAAHENAMASKASDQYFGQELVRTSGDFVDHDMYWSAFTVAELGDMLPEYTESYRTSSENIYRTVYYDEVFEDGETMFEALTEAEARGLMLAYLIENKLITV